MKKTFDDLDVGDLFFAYGSYTLWRKVSGDGYSEVTPRGTASRVDTPGPRMRVLTLTIERDCIRIGRYLVVRPPAPRSAVEDHPRIWDEVSGSWSPTVVPGGGDACPTGP